MLLGAHDEILVDPVCGRSIEATSPHRVIHGGALFVFCSPACRARFVELPSRYAVIATAMSNRWVEPSPSAPVPLTPTPAPSTELAKQAVAQPASMRTAGTALPDLQNLDNVTGPFTWLLAWRERRYANACARSMLELFHQLKAQHPELDGPSLYRRVVAARVGDATEADGVLRHAEQSFAVWPVERGLTFRDVVHYLAVSEFVAQHRNARWVVADMKRVVDAVIPHQL